MPDGKEYKNNLISFIDCKSKIFRWNLINLLKKSHEDIQKINKITALLEKYKNMKKPCDNFMSLRKNLIFMETHCK